MKTLPVNYEANQSTSNNTPNIKGHRKIACIRDAVFQLKDKLYMLID